MIDIFIIILGLIFLLPTIIPLIVITSEIIKQNGKINFDIFMNGTIDIVIDSRNELKDYPIFWFYVIEFSSIIIGISLIAYGI